MFSFFMAFDFSGFLGYLCYENLLPEVCRSWGHLLETYEMLISAALHMSPAADDLAGFYWGGYYHPEGPCTQYVGT